MSNKPVRRMGARTGPEQGREPVRSRAETGSEKFTGARRSWEQNESSPVVHRPLYWFKKHS